jgi:hypothetical protein
MFTAAFTVNTAPDNLTFTVARSEQTIMIDPYVWLLSTSGMMNLNKTRLYSRSALPFDPAKMATSGTIETYGIFDLNPPYGRWHSGFYTM